jgi:hypothetical protein
MEIASHDINYSDSIPNKGYCRLQSQKSIDSHESIGIVNIDSETHGRKICCTF